MPSKSLSSYNQKTRLLALCDSAVKGLAPMFDPKRQLFCYRRKLTAKGLTNEGASQRYTVITLLGLLEAKGTGMESLFDVDSIFAGLTSDLGWVEGAGDLGLLLWLSSRMSPDHVKDLCAKVDLNQALEQGSDAQQGMTTELAWFLTGLSESTLAMPAVGSLLYALAIRVLEMLLANQGPSGLFGHLAKGATLASRLRSHVGCFADQVYPIYALTRCAAAFECNPALSAAQRCGATICELQGDKGQWWWHYDSTKGRVFGKYPVFSVHQDGMAPMALLALAKATRQDFWQPISKGLDWIYGNNELGLDLRNEGHQLIWRSIYDGDRYARYLAGGLSLLGLHDSGVMPGKLQIKYECRPYHLGWILFAFASEARLHEADDDQHARGLTVPNSALTSVGRANAAAY